MRPWFDWLRGALPRRAETPVDELILVPFYCSHRTLLAELEENLAVAFRCRPQQRPPEFDPETAFDPARGQYNSRALLGHLLAQHRGSGRMLGVTEVDLFIPVLTFVFGEAQLGGPIAVVSTHRLAPEWYGIPADDRLLGDRLEKEAIHELGHTYGLLHCSDLRCVMASSPHVDGIDLKLPRFCARCREALERARPREVPQPP